MKELMNTFGVLAFVLLAGWALMAGLGLTTMPTSKKKKVVRQMDFARAKGQVWAHPVVTSQMGDDIGTPAAVIM